MADTYTWLDRGGERVFYLDDPARPGARWLAVRPGAGEGDWSTACLLAPDGAVEEIGDGLAAPSIAEDVILKYAIQALAHRHGVSPAPGLPDQEAGEVEVVIMKLWQALTARWAPPGAAGGEGPGAAG